MNNNKQNNYAYVELLFEENTKDYFKGIVQNVVDQDQFYYSDVVKRISGDVTDKIHFTLFYGIEETEIDNPKLKQLVSQLQVKELLVKGLTLFSGYQDLYRVLCVEIADEDNYLESLSKQLLQFKHAGEFGQREFKPHITLAYIQPQFKLPANYVVKSNVIKVEEARLSI